MDQHQNLLQEQRKQLMLQQQIQGQINKKYTFTNNSNFHTLSNPNSSQAKKFKGFAQVNQIDRKNSSNSNNTQIRQAQTSINPQSSNPIKQSKTFLKTNNKIHDRFIVVDYGTKDARAYLCGSSSKDSGKKVTMIMEMKEPENIKEIVGRFLHNPELKLK